LETVRHLRIDGDFRVRRDGKAGAPACLLEFAAYAFCTLGGAVAGR